VYLLASFPAPSTFFGEFPPFLRLATSTLFSSVLRLPVPFSSQAGASSVVEAILLKVLFWYVLAGQRSITVLIYDFSLRTSHSAFIRFSPIINPPALQHLHLRLQQVNPLFLLFLPSSWPPTVQFCTPSQLYQRPSISHTVSLSLRS
jgi:hypothetical protein